MTEHEDGHLYSNREGLLFCLCSCCTCNNAAGQCCCPDEDREACGYTHGEPDADGGTVEVPRTGTFLVRFGKVEEVKVERSDITGYFNTFRKPKDDEDE